MGYSFSASTVTPNENSYAPIEPGEYVVVMDDLEEKETKAGGVSWSFKMKIPASGRTFFLNYNVENANKVAENIARADILDIAKAMGLNPDNIDLNTMRSNKQFKIKLEQRVVGDKTYYSAKNWAMIGSQPTVASAPPAAKKKNPWD